MKLGDMESIMRDMNAGVWDFTKNGECSNCGECCADFLPVSVREIQVIRKYIRKNRIREQVHFMPTARPCVDFICPFRNNSNRKCEIYEVRPAICRNFRCDKPKKKLWADPELYRGKMMIVSMRETFYPKTKKKGEHQ